MHHVSTHQWIGLVGLIVSAMQGPPAIARADTVESVENDKLSVTVDAARKRISVIDKIGGHRWQQPQAGGSPGWAAAPSFRNLRRTEGEAAGLSFEAECPSGPGRWLPVTITLTLPPGSANLDIACEAKDPPAPCGDIEFLEPFILDTPDAVLAVADYCDGRLYPLDGDTLPLNPTINASLEWFPADRLDLPLVMLCDLRTGLGYALIIDTSDDAAVACRKYPAGSRQVFAPHVVWQASRGAFGYPRRLTFSFTSEGGYVALCKAYRAMARERGLLVTLADKAKINPNVERLFGAACVWGDDRFAMAKDARAAGVDKMLIQCGLDRSRPSPEVIRATNDLGYLTSEYDCYTDMLPVEAGRPVDHLHGQVPGEVAMTADGRRMTGWVEESGRQYMQRCARRWVPTAEQVIPGILSTHPFNARFIDVTTATGLYECHNPAHPLTRAQKRECGQDLLRYVRSQGVLVGGEHGIWWAVPHLDWIEGMMSGAYYPWPAGHLKRPRSRSDQFTSPAFGKLASWAEYEKWGLGPAWRAPLWELVFHDCVVSTWYWGDSNDWLRDVDPELVARKDAFTILYGAMPMLWAGKDGSWENARGVFLRSYYVTGKFHEAVAPAEMLSHRFVTADRTVQETRFADGTRVMVNFGDQPFATEYAGDKVVMPRNGFVVTGPRVEQSCTLVGSQTVTSIRAGGKLFTDLHWSATSRPSVGE